MVGNKPLTPQSGRIARRVPDKNRPLKPGEPSVFDDFERIEHVEHDAEYAHANRAWWPSTQTGWLKHLTEVNRSTADPLGRGKLTSIAKRLHLERQTMNPADFDNRYWRLIPDLNWDGGMRDSGLLYRLPDALSKLTGDGIKTPVRLLTAAQAAERLGIDVTDLQCVLNRHTLAGVTPEGYRPVKRGNRDAYPVKLIDEVRRRM